MRRIAAILAGIVLALVAACAIAYAILDGERHELDAKARARAPGEFVRLHDGVTHYELAGPEAGRTVVLLSGASVPYYIWDPTYAFLVASGFRALRYDYFGRGYSDRPKLRYELADYDRQLIGLLAALRIRGTVDVMGVSMGGIVAASFADRHPERVRSLTLIDAGFGGIPRTPLPLRLPVIGKVVLTLAAPALARDQLKDFLHPERHPDWVGRYRVQTRYRGFTRSLLATVRGNVLKRPAASFTTLAGSRIPVLVLWGTADRTEPLSGSDEVRAAFPRAEFHAIEGAAHLPQIEQPAVVDSLLLDFLRRSP